MTSDRCTCGHAIASHDGWGQGACAAVRCSCEAFTDSSGQAVQRVLDLADELAEESHDASLKPTWHRWPPARPR